MKQSYIFSALLLAMTVMPAWAQSSASLSNVDSQWGKLLVSSGVKTTTTGGQLVKGNDGSLYMLAAAGTKTSADVVSMGDTPIANGTQNTSTSYNQNFVLSKLNTSDGTPVWTVASVTGEVATTQQWAAATSDGGVIAAFSMRHTYGRLTDSIALVDATGDTTTVDWALETGATERYYRLAVMKVTADGAISWIRQIAVNHDPQPGATSDAYKKITPTGAYLYGMTVDSNDNIYLSGRVCTALTLTKADGSTVDITAHNVEGWSGDPQKSVGSLYIVKLDAQGNYLNSITSGGAATCEAMRGMKIKNNTLYVYGVIQGLAGTDITLGDKRVTMTGANTSWATANLSLDLDKVNFFKVYESTLSGSAINNPNMIVNDNDIYLMGQCKNAVDVEGTTVSTPSTRNAMLLKADAATGTLEAAITDATAFSSFFDAFEDQSQNIYLGYYTLNGALKLVKYDEATLTKQDEVQLFSNCATGQSLVVDGQNLYAMTRCKGSNLTSKAPATSAKAPFVVNATEYSCLISAYTLPFTASTAVKNVNAETTATAVIYYNLQGIASNEPQPGINIKVTTYSDGSREAVKIMQ